MSIAEQMVGRMVKQAFDAADVPVKQVAYDSNCSGDAIYATIRGTRKIPRDARGSISQVHPLAGLAVAYEATGYEVFLAFGGDQHPQNVLQKALKEDRDVDQALEGLSWRLIDKTRAEDLDEDDQAYLNICAREVAQEIRALWGVLVNWQSVYGIDAVKILNDVVSEKEKTALLTAAR